jgi:hypothetical protein
VAKHNARVPNDGCATGSDAVSHQANVSGGGVVGVINAFDLLKFRTVQVGHVRVARSGEGNVFGFVAECARSS